MTLGASESDAKIYYTINADNDPNPNENSDPSDPTNVDRKLYDPAQPIA